MPSTPDFNEDRGEACDPVVREAADWFAMRYQGLTSVQKAEFDLWLQANPRHAEIFGEMEETWSLLGPDPQPALPVVAVKSRALRTWIHITLAAAAVLTAACILWRAEINQSRDFSETVSTDIGTLHRLELPDRSILQLSADSAVNVHFTRSERRIVLQRGEAIFLVSKNSARPFIVRAGAVEIRAVGTAFDVLLQASSVDLLVTQGKVQVTDKINGGSLLDAAAGSEPLLLAGQHVHIALNNSRALAQASPEAISAEKIRDLLAWEQRRLVFHGDSLADIVAKFNRFNRHRLVIGSPELAGLRFGGTYLADDYEAFVKSLEVHYGIIGEERSSDETVLKLAVSNVREEAPLPSSPALAEKYLVFRLDRLADIVAAFNRYNRHKLIIDGTDLANQRFGGTFPVGDYEAFVNLLKENFDIMVVQRDNETILRAAPQSAAVDKFP